MAEVGLETAGAVAIITIDNLEARNGLTPELARQLAEVCEEIDAREELGAAVIRGANDTFCSGADTRAWAPDLAWAGNGYELLSEIYEGFKRVGELRVPTIAAVQGAAVGAGMNLMLACDLRVVAHDARLIAGFLRIGLHPGGGFFTLLSRAGGRELATAMGLFGQELDGRRAAERGLAWESVDADVLGSRAVELAAMAAKDPVLARHAVATLRGEVGPPAVSWENALEMERGVQAWSMHRRFASAADGSP